jgi:hypothetical protein
MPLQFARDALNPARWKARTCRSLVRSMPQRTDGAAVQADVAFMMVIMDAP